MCTIYVLILECLPVEVVFNNSQQIVSFSLVFVVHIHHLVTHLASFLLPLL